MTDALPHSGYVHETCKIPPHVENTKAIIGDQTLDSISQIILKTL